METPQEKATVAYLVPRAQASIGRNHSVHFYDEDAGLVRIVTDVVAEGLAAGDSVVVVATAEHLRDLELALDPLEVALARRRGRLVTVDADEALAEFMVAGRPDRERFEQLIERHLEGAKAAAETTRVRIYGEMVNVLWRQGNRAATLELEEIWCDLVSRRSCSLVCAYLLDGFSSADDGAEFQAICDRHEVVHPAGDFASLSPEQKLRRVAELEQRARVLEEEIERRKAIEAERARLLEVASRAAAEVTLLYRLTDAANRAETLQQVYEVALDGIATALGADRAAILLFDADGVDRFKAWRGLSDAYRAAVEGHSPWRPEDGDPGPVVVEDVRADPEMARFLPVFEREGIGAVAFMPLLSGGRLLGKFMVYHPRPHAFTEQERRLGTAIAGQIAFAVERRLAAQERERLLGIVGHDLRNPLSAVTMSAASLLRQEVSEDSSRVVRRILSSAERMDRLIGQMLDFARARQGGGIAIQRKPSDVGEIARRVLDEMDAAHPARTLALSVDGDTAGEWDGDRLAQVLSNLVANAIQHGRGDAVEVSLQGGRAEVVVEVHNHGDPIAPGLLADLFDPFRRGEKPGSGRVQNVGLGLFISREIVRAHGGGIAVRSSASEGTTFTVRLPRRSPASRSSSPTSASTW